MMPSVYVPMIRKSTVSAKENAKMENLTSQKAQLIFGDSTTTT